MSQPLSPCPFCRGVAEFERLGTPRQSCIVKCTDCGARHESPDEGDHSGSSWNHRPLEDEARECFAAIDEKIRAMSAPLVEWLNRDGTPDDVRRAYKACVYSVAIRCQVFASGAKGDRLVELFDRLCEADSVAEEMLACGGGGASCANVHAWAKRLKIDG